MQGSWHWRFGVGALQCLCLVSVVLAYRKYFCQKKSKHAMGAMAQLKTLYIQANAFSDASKEQLQAACQARGIGLVG